MDALLESSGVSSPPPRQTPSDPKIDVTVIVNSGPREGLGIVAV